MPTIRVRRPWTGLLLAAWCASASPLAAQERDWPTRETLPGSVVLVLKLLDAAHARPTTGVVLSADGLVMVPADFVSAGDELVVLDGGTDVFRNGRPARTAYRSPEAGIAVLAVEGLQRVPAPLAMAPVSGPLHLAAFPSAEQLTSGALPVWVTVDTSASSPDLPDLPGPLLDRCGHLAAYALGDPARPPLDLDTLTRTLGEFGLVLNPVACGAISDSQTGEQRPAETSRPVIAPAMPEGDDRLAAKTPADADDGSSDATADAQAPLGTAQMSALEGDDPMVRHTGGLSPATRQAFAVSLATVLGLLAWWWFRWRRRTPKTSTEPDTLELLPERLAPQGESLARPAASGDGRRLRARLPGGGILEHGLPPGEGRALTIGRAGDFAIDHPSLSREHVRVEISADGVWIVDLGSTNGTLIGRVPCLPGEIMAWPPDVSLLLGDVVVSLEEAEGAA